MIGEKQFGHLIFYIPIQINKYKLQMRQQAQVNPNKMLETAQKTKGYLEKKATSIVGDWQRRYFLIINSTMVYYPDQTLEKKKGTIQLKEVTKIVMRKDKEFTLQTRKRTFEFRCATQNERNLWVASLNLIKQSSDMSPIKRFLIRAQNQEKIQEQTRLKEITIERYRQAITMMKLPLILSKIQQSWIKNRIFCSQVEEKSFFICISIKSLVNPELDEEILSQKYIEPYEFNKLYLVNSQKVKEICKMSLIHSFTAKSDCLILIFPDKKELKIPIKNQYDAKIVSDRVQRCYKVAKQYYNPFKVILKRNVDRLVWLYDNYPENFQEQVRSRVQKYFKYQSSHEPVTIFISEFNQLKKCLIEIEEACKVLSYPRDDVKTRYFHLAHQVIVKNLRSGWENLYQFFQPFQFLVLAGDLYEYWVLINQIVSDSSLLDGCCDLTHFFLRKKGEQIKLQIESIHFTKVQVKKNKNQLNSNEVTNTFYEWLAELIKGLHTTVPIQKVFDEFCKFFIKVFDEFTQYLNDIMQRWTESHILFGVCNDISRIKKFFSQKVGSQLCQGIIPEAKFQTLCANLVRIRLNECEVNAIKRVFLIIFSSIDKKVLNKPFLQLDIGKICYEVLQRLEPYKNKVDQFVQDEIIMLSFDEICFFVFTCLLKRKILAVKNSKEIYVKALDKGMTQIQQYYCNIKTQVKVKKHLAEISVLKEVLLCAQIHLENYCKELRKIFGLAFNEDCIENILKIKQFPEESWDKVYYKCCEVLKSSESEDSSSKISSQIYQNRPRTSTLTESLNNHNVFEAELVTFIENGRQGYLIWKKIEKKTIPSFGIQSYFKLQKGKLVQYKAKGSYEIGSTINLSKMQKCYMEHLKDSTFIIDIKSVKYYFQAPSRDEAGKWIQAICAETNHPMFENTILNRGQKQSTQCLFKDFEAQPPTTDTVGKKNSDVEQDTEIFKQKRSRRMGQLNRSKAQTPVSPIKKEKIKKQQKTKSPLKKKHKGEEEGSCCSANFF